MTDITAKVPAQDLPETANGTTDTPPLKSHSVYTVDNRFRVDISRDAPPPMASAQLVIKVYPVTDGQVWDEPYDVFVVDEGRVVELENDAREDRP